MHQELAVLKGNTRKVKSPECDNPNSDTAIHAEVIGNVTDILERYRDPFEYIDHEAFHMPDADEILISTVSVESRFHGRLPTESSEHSSLDRVFRHQLLSQEYERELFLQMNYLRFKAEQLRATQAGAVPVNGTLHEIDEYLAQAKKIAKTIVRHNMRLAAIFARRIYNPGDRDEFISEAAIALMRAVEKYDVSRGFVFSTYGTHAINRRFVRFIQSREKKRRQLYQQPVSNTAEKAMFGSLCDQRGETPIENYTQRLQSVVYSLLITISGRERSILIHRFGLDGTGAKTQEETSKLVSVSKSRVQQVEVRALGKLQTLTEQLVGNTTPDRGDLPKPIQKSTWQRIFRVLEIEEYLPLTGFSNLAGQSRELFIHAHPLIEKELEKKLPNDADVGTAVEDVWLLIAIELSNIVNFRAFMSRLRKITTQYKRMLLKQGPNNETSVVATFEELAPELAERLHARFTHFETDQEYKERIGCTKGRADQHLLKAKKLFKDTFVAMRWGKQLPSV